MSTLRDAFEALRRVVLKDANIERLERNVGDLAGNVDGLADGLANLRDRVARLEGFVEGAAAASQARPRLPGR